MQLAKKASKLESIVHLIKYIDLYTKCHQSKHLTKHKRVVVTNEMKQQPEVVSHVLKNYFFGLIL